MVEQDSRPPVYMAGPIDYIEHRSPGQHLRDNWRHRFFGDLPIEILCPTCMNAEPIPVWPDPLPPDGPIEIGLRPREFSDIMVTNKQAMERAQWFIGYFPGDAATFGTPIEVWAWVEQAFQQNRADHAALIHPSRPGVFVEYLAAIDRLVVVRTFEQAREWLRHQLSITP